MEHYFTNNPTSESNEHEIKYLLNDKPFKFMVDNGVFSKAHVDIATDFMLKTIINEDIHGNVLDVGCGYGVIGIVLSKFFEIKCKMLDINERALGLAKKNITLNGCKNIDTIESDGFEAIKDDEKFDIIVTNPPIRAGKQVIYAMYEEAYKHLKDDGAFYLVINKKHGAPSTITFLKTMFASCEVLDKKTGFNVIKCSKKNI